MHISRKIIIIDLNTCIIKLHHICLDYHFIKIVIYR